MALERGLELAITLRNLRWAKERGGLEFGRRHYPWMVLLHTGFLVACVGEVLALDRPFIAGLGWPMLALVVLTMALRYWAIATLGRRWSTRVVVIPGMSAEAGGPFRFLRHPNYLAVVVEGFALPLVHTAWLTAIAFEIGNAILLAIRVRVEERALREHSSYDRVFSSPETAPGSGDRAVSER